MINIDIIFYYLLTCLIEIIILLILSERRKKVILFSLLINAITNIPLNLFLRYNKIDSILYHNLTVIVFEIIIMFIESLLYFFIIKEKKKSFMYGFFCNAFSFTIGIIITELLSIANVNL